MTNADKNIFDDHLIKYQNSFYKLMVEYLGEEIFVADGNGKVLFVNPASAKTIGLPVDQIVGRSAQELEQEGYIKPSCTLEVLRQRKLVNMLQDVQGNRTLLATGVPIWDNEQENILMVITTSKDVDEVNRLVERVEQQQREISLKNVEIENLRDLIFEEEGLIYGDVYMKQVRDAVVRVAPLEVTVLVEGETGVGKEVVTRTIHRFSTRKNKSMVKINCGIIPENLIESELFGYEPGAFTGAQREGKPGKVEMADGGTLFLDEIGEMPLHMQVKLLDFLQDGTFTRVGGTKKRKVDTRIIAATNRNLKEMCEKGDFRQDLYFRLNVIPIRIPPLRERVGDVAVLSKHFISNYNVKYKSFKKLGAGVLEQLYGYHWPGNVRELEHVLERAYVLSDGNTIGAELMEMILSGNRYQAEQHLVMTDLMPLKEAKREVERQLVSRAYEQLGTTYKVAEVLEIDQSTVVKLIKKHGLGKVNS